MASLSRLEALFLEVASYALKGTLDNFILIPQFFFQKNGDFYSIRNVLYTYVVTACSILLATSTQLQRYMNFSFSSHFWKSTS